MNLVVAGKVIGGLAVVSSVPVTSVILWDYFSLYKEEQEAIDSENLTVVENTNSDGKSSVKISLSEKWSCVVNVSGENITSSDNSSLKTYFESKINGKDKQLNRKQLVEVCSKNRTKVIVPLETVANMIASKIENSITMDFFDKEIRTSGG